MSGDTSSEFVRWDVTKPWLARLAHGCLTVGQATAFWLTIPLPVVLIVALVTGVATRYPLFFGSLVCLNALCALAGHGHTPRS